MAKLKMPETQSDVTVAHVQQALRNLQKNRAAWEAFFIGFGWPEGITYCHDIESVFTTETAIPGWLSGQPYQHNPSMCLWLCRYFMLREDEK